MNFFARLASSSASWALVGASRAAVGAVVAAAVAHARGVSLAANDRRAVFWRSVFGTGAMLSTFYALSSRTLSLGDTATLLNLTPVFLGLLAPIFLRERTSLAVGAGIAVSLAGVVLVLRPAVIFGGGHSLVSATGPSAAATAAVAALAALVSSFAMMLLRRVGQTETPEAIAFHFSVFAAVTLALIAVF
ncbi:MAG TPA: EamA family transporter, partial [Labilithrix sp.]